MDFQSATTNLYALLIGIDCYLPNRLPDGSYYPNLQGCVADVTRTQEFLLQRLALPNDHILRLTASNTPGNEPPEPRDQWPTYENIVAAFRTLTEMAQPGDQVYIHYSGQGGRTPTIVPEIKGPNAHDEVLVPMDIGTSEARYLRDIELAKLLQALVDKQLVITVVLDSCHSGGATRGSGAAVRGIDTIDTTARPTESLVASHEDLAATWRSLNKNATRDLKLGSGWLPEPRDYVLLAACRPSESAYEYAFDGKEKNGALTYWLLDALSRMRPGLRYRQLHDRLISKVHSQFENQTPQLEGDSNRIVFGSDHVQLVYSVSVMQVNQDRVELQVGQATLVRKGAQFAVYPRGTTDFTDVSKRQAIVEVAELGATTSWAKILNTFGTAPIEQGAQALLLGAASVKLVRQVRLLQEPGDIPYGIDQRAARQALQAVEQAIETVGKGWLELSRNGDTPAEYHVAITSNSEYEIRDRTGSVAIANLNPPLRIDNPQAATAVVQRLVHLTRYSNVRELENSDPLSPLAGKLVVELTGVQRDYDPADNPEPQPFDALGNVPTIEVGEWTFLRIKNTSVQSLNVTVLDLQPDWGISQVYPSGAGDLFVEIDAGEEHLLPLQAALPDGYTEGSDILKVFATLDAADFRWLELPVLDKPIEKRAATRGGMFTPLDELLHAVSSDEAIHTRSLTPSSNPPQDWFIAQVEVRTHRPESDSDAAQVARLNRTVADLYAQGLYRQALTTAQEAIALARRSLGEAHPAFATSLRNLGMVSTALGYHAHARSLFEQELTLRGTIQGEAHPEYATSLNNLARLYRMIGKFADAEVLMRQAIEIQRVALGDRHPAYADSLDNLATLHKAIGHYADAESGYQRALAIRRVAFGESSPQLVQSLDNLAALALEMGDYTATEQYYLQALELQRTALGSDHPAVAHTLNKLTGLSLDLGDYAAAEQFCRQALMIEQATGDRVGEGTTLNHMGATSAGFAQYQQAIESYEQALAIAREIGDRVGEGRSLSCIGGAYTAEARYSEALEVYSRALDILTAALGADHLDVAAISQNLASIYLDMADYTSAEPLYDRALEIQRKVLGEDHPDIATGYNNLALLLAATDRPGAALDTARRAADVDDRFLSLVVSSPPSSRRTAYLQRVRERSEVFLNLCVQHFPTSPAAVRDALDLVLRRKQVDIEALAAPRAAALARRYPDLAPDLQNLARLHTQIAHKALVGPSDESSVTYQRLLMEWNSERDRQMAKLARQIPELNVARQLEITDRQAVARTLPTSSMLAEFVCFRVCDFPAAPASGQTRWKPICYVAFILPAGEPNNVHLIDLGEAKPIDELLHSFRGASASAQQGSSSRRGTALANPEQSPAGIGARLRKAIFDPVLTAIGECKHLVIAPDGGLIRLPFAALPTDDGRYLIDTYHMSYLQSGRDALWFEAGLGDQHAEPLIIADPDFKLRSPKTASSSPARKTQRPQLHGATSLTEFHPLPGTRREAEQIATRVGGTILSGATALKSSVKAFHSPRILHIAAPGFFLADQPDEPNGGRIQQSGLGSEGEGPVRQASLTLLQRSGFALAGANTWLQGDDLPSEAEDGLLTAQDITSLDLSGTQLVVLSACNISGGVSESLAGLQRAFLLAGARVLVMNLWTAPDQQIIELMNDFYSRILSGQSYAQAVRDAQMAIKAKYPIPFFWGAFTCYGDLSPLPAAITDFVKADNPYVVGPPAEGAIFVGRRDILNTIQDHLEPMAGKNILVLRGQRRTGKTSVLFRLRETLSKEKGSAYIPVLIDMQGMSGVEDENGFFFRMAWDIWEQLQNQGVDLPEPAEEDFAKSPRNEFELRFLKQATQATGRRILMMIDEFDEIKELIEGGYLPNSVLKYWRHLMQHRPVLFLIAGTQKLREFTGSYWSVFFNLQMPVDIGTLTEAAARGLITEPVKRWYTMQPDAVNEIVRVAGCHPYFTQLVCQKLLELRNASRSNSMSIAHVAIAIKGALESGDDQIGYPWTEKDCSADERLVLSVLAREKVDDAPVPISMLRQQLAVNMAVDISAAAKRLADRGVVYLDDADQFSFVVPLFQLWLVQKHYDILDNAVQYNQEHHAARLNGGETHA